MYKKLQEETNEQIGYIHEISELLNFFEELIFTRTYMEINVKLSKQLKDALLLSRILCFRVFKYRPVLNQAVINRA